jgi:CBS domain-containing protein
MKVKDAMQRGVHWVSPDTPVIELAKLMREHASGRYQPFGARPYFGRMGQERLVILWRGLNSHFLAASARPLSGVRVAGQQ